MQQKIIDNIGDPEILEQLYRENSREFAKCFSEVADQFDSELVRIWRIRLSYGKTEQSGFKWSELWIVIVIALITGALLKIPALFGGIKEEVFYPRDLALIAFNGIIIYTFYFNKITDKRKWLFYGLTVLILSLFANLLPVLEKSDSINLALGHIALLLWCVFGLSFISFDYKKTEKRMAYIRFNGEYIIMNGLLYSAGMLLVFLSFGLFQAIKIDLMKVFYNDYIMVFGASAIPIVSLYLIRRYPDITKKISPVIARVFTPLVLISLMVYLILLIFSVNKIGDDREALLVFNIMLLAIMAIIVFSVSELDKDKTKDFNILVLFMLAALAIVADAIALFAISSRLQVGITPNRVVVFVSNILIFINLVFIAKSLFRSYFLEKPVEEVDKSVAGYIPVYIVYTLFVIFALPFIFGFY